VAHLRPEIANELGRKQNIRFAAVDFEIELMYDGVEIPIKLLATEFSPASEELLRVPVVVYGTGSGQVVFEDRCPYPIALRGASIDLLIEKFQSHANLIIESEGSFKKMIPRGMNKVSREVLQLVDRYHSSNRSSGPVCLLSQCSECPPH